MKKTKKAAKQVVEEGKVKETIIECGYHVAVITMMFLVSHVQPGYAILENSKG